MDAVAELVRERRDVAAGSGVARQHVGVMAGSPSGAEGAKALPRTNFGVDPLAVEKRLREVGERAAEAAECVEDQRPRLGESHPLVDVVDGRVDVGTAETGEVKDARLQGEEAPDDRVVPLDDVHHDCHGLRVELVGEMRGRGDVAIAAEITIDPVVEDERIGDGREGECLRCVLAEQGAERAGAQVTVGVMEQGHQLAVGEDAVGAVDPYSETQRTGELVVELDERGRSADALAGEQPLLGFAEHVGLETPERLQKMGIVGEDGVGTGPGEAPSSRAVELEIDEDEQGAQVGLLLDRALLEVERLWAAAVSGREQRGIEPRPLTELEDGLVLDQGAAQVGSRGSGAEDSAPFGCEPLAAGVRRACVGEKAGVVRTGIELTQIPTHRVGGHRRRVAASRRFGERLETSQPLWLVVKKKGWRAPFSLHPARTHAVADAGARVNRFAARPKSRRRGATRQWRNTGEGGKKMGAFAMQDSGGHEGRSPWLNIGAIALILTALCTDAPAHAGCALPGVFGITAEEHGLLDRGSSGVIITGPPSEAGLVAGDVVRQANGVRVKECADLERAAADALAQGLVLLLAVERGDARIAVAATTRASAARDGTIASSASPPAVAVAPPSRGEARAATATPTPIPPPPRREMTLPPRAGAAEALVRRAEAAAATLANLDAAAKPMVPLALYERRLGEAQAAIGTLEFGSTQTIRRSTISSRIRWHCIERHGTCGGCNSRS